MVVIQCTRPGKAQSDRVPGMEKKVGHEAPLFNEKRFAKSLLLEEQK